MPYHHNPVVWAGVALRTADGAVHAWEFAEGLELAEFTREVDAWDVTRFGEHPRFVLPPEETIDVHLRAHRAKYWRQGAESAPAPQEPARAIAEAPRGIEAS